MIRSRTAGVLQPATPGACFPTTEPKRNSEVPPPAGWIVACAGWRLWSWFWSVQFQCNASVQLPKKALSTTSRPHADNLRHRGQLTTSLSVGFVLSGILQASRCRAMQLWTSSGRGSHCLFCSFRIRTAFPRAERSFTTTSVLSRAGASSTPDHSRRALRSLKTKSKVRSPTCYFPPFH